MSLEAKEFLDIWFYDEDVTDLNYDGVDDMKYDTYRVCFDSKSSTAKFEFNSYEFIPHDSNDYERVGVTCEYKIVDDKFELIPKKYARLGTYGSLKASKRWKDVKIVFVMKEKGVLEKIEGPGGDKKMFRSAENYGGFKGKKKRRYKSKDDEDRMYCYPGNLYDDPREVVSFE